MSLGSNPFQEVLQTWLECLSLMFFRRIHDTETSFPVTWSQLSSLGLSDKVDGGNVLPLYVCLYIFFLAMVTRELTFVLQQNLGKRSSAGQGRVP